MVSPAQALPSAASAPVRHTLLVRVTHWITALCFALLLLSGLEIVVSHPRFYWGEEGNVMTPSLFDIPIPASRPYVKTGYDYVLPDQNGWSRSLHFQTAWIIVFTGLLYGIYALRSGHLRNNLLPARGHLSPAVLAASIRDHLRFKPLGEEALWSYNVLQRIAYLFVVFALLPFLIWTGLAMSPSVTAAFPFLVDAVGGHQSARTLHFFATIALVLFFFVHIGMVVFAGFKSTVLAMITGGVRPPGEQP